MADIQKRMIDFGNKSTDPRHVQLKTIELLYTCRFLSDLLDRLDADTYRVQVSKFKSLDGSISTARKLLRLGKSLEMLYSAKQAMHIQDVVIQACVTMSRLASAFFLFLDHILWLQRVKAIKIDPQPISRLSNQFWLLSTILNLIRNLYDWKRIHRFHSTQQRRAVESQPVDVPRTMPTLLDTIKNSFDVLIPLNGLGYMKVPGVVQGSTGVVSSMIGIATLWNDKLKLVNI